MGLRLELYANICLFLFRAIFTNPKTGKIVKAGDKIKFLKLAETYRRIANGGKETFYNGTLRDDIMADLNELGEIVTL